MQIETLMSGQLNNKNITITGLEIIRQIGHGGMSVVYLAEQHAPKRQVAVKIMRFQANSHQQDLQRFKNEANTIAQLSHPNIITIYKIGETTDGDSYFTMPYLNHGDFSTYIYEDDTSFIQLLHAICNGLDFAHNKGIIHRDIKPENLLFDECRHIKIADFGVAQSQGKNDLTEEHHIIGSAKYMSPEQTRSSKVDHRTDIYSLGIVIYEKLTGTVPFNSGDSISILIDHVSTAPPNLPNNHAHWQSFIDKCLAKDPDERFQSISDVKKALDEITTKSNSRPMFQHISTIKKYANHRHLKWYLLAFVITTLAWSIIKHQYPANDFVEMSDQETSSIDFVSAQIDQTDEVLLAESVNNLKQVNTDQKSEVTELLLNAYKNINETIFLAPGNNQVTSEFLHILTLDPDNQEAIKGLKYIENKYIDLVILSLNQSNYQTALQLARSLGRFNTQTRNITGQAYLQKQKVTQIIEELNSASIPLTTLQARNMVKILITLSMNELAQQLNTLANKRLNTQIGERFLDYQSIMNTKYADINLVVSNEITVNDYHAFSKATKRIAAKCIHQTSFIGRIKKINKIGRLISSKNWKKHYFDQKDNHPVVCININDAKSYASWLSKKTGNNYRLLTQEEWLFLATPSVDALQHCKAANHAGQESKKVKLNDLKYSCADNFTYTAPVKSFQANDLGLFDIHGNVSEWIACNTDTCSTAVAMGSSWSDGQNTDATTHIQEHKNNDAFSHIGFRLVRDIQE